MLTTKMKQEESKHEGPYLCQTARIRDADPPMTTFQTSSPYHSQPTPSTYHLGGSSSRDPYVTTTHTSERYSSQDPTSQPVRPYKPRPPMVKSPHILLGIPMGFTTGLTRFEQDMILELSEAADTYRYRQEL
ncbi:hypothetical protein Tco_1049431 [Tanacetum coccineum]